MDKGLTASKNDLELMAAAADLIAEGDIVNRSMRTT
jgi:hypothetical protein